MSNLSLPHGVPRRKTRSSFGLMYIIILTAVPSMVFGATLAMLFKGTNFDCSLHHESIEERIRDEIEESNEHHVGKLVNQKIRKDLERICEDQVGRTLERHEEHEANRDANTELFPTDSMGRFAAAMARVDRAEFVEMYDPGVPLDRSSSGASQVLMVYSNAKAAPSALTDHNEIPELSTKEALDNCEMMHIALVDHGTRKQCLAIIPQYESFHLQKWMRINSKGELNKDVDFQMVSRGHKTNGQNEFDPPDLNDARKHWKMLQQYFDNVDDVLSELKPLLAKIAKQNTVIVMVVNFGQSELLINFVCAARNRNMDISNVIVFTTDQESTDIANGMGLTTYFDKRVR